MFDHGAKYADKIKDSKVDKRGRMRCGTIGFTGFTFARPGTKEYRRFLVEPQHPAHIQEIHKYLALRLKLGTEHKYVEHTR